MKAFKRHILCLVILFQFFAVALPAQSAPAPAPAPAPAASGASGAPAAGGEEKNAVTGDTWLMDAWGKVRDCGKKVWGWLSQKVHTMLLEDMGMGEADASSAVVLLIIVGVLSVMLASGAWAASIAQMRRHPAPKFFVYGFFTFFFGPAHLLYTLDIKGEAEQKARFAEAAAKKRAEEEERAKLEEQQAVARGKEAPAVSADGVIWDKAYFAGIQRKADGTPAGPWAVEFNGIAVTVLQIVEVYDENVQVMMLNLEGSKTMGRIPFAKLQKWEEIDGAPYQEMMAGENPEEKAQEAAPVVEDASAEEEGPAWNEEYFTSIQTKEDGTPNGPWNVTYNGIEVQVVQIVEVLKECVQVKMINLEGTPTNGRIPYKRIEKWVDAE